MFLGVDGFRFHIVFNRCFICWIEAWFIYNHNHIVISCRITTTYQNFKKTLHIKSEFTGTIMIGLSSKKRGKNGWVRSNPAFLLSKTQLGDNHYQQNTFGHFLNFLESFFCQVIHDWQSGAGIKIVIWISLQTELLVVIL